MRLLTLPVFLVLFANTASADVFDCTVSEVKRDKLEKCGQANVDTTASLSKPATVFFCKETWIALFMDVPDKADSVTTINFGVANESNLANGVRIEAPGLKIPDVLKLTAIDDAFIGSGRTFMAVCSRTKEEPGAKPPTHN